MECHTTQLRTQLKNIGLDVEPFHQTYARYSPASKTAEIFISRKRIKHNGDPILAWRSVMWSWKQMLIPTLNRTKRKQPIR